MSLKLNKEKLHHKGKAKPVINGICTMECIFYALVTIVKGGGGGIKIINSQSFQAINLKLCPEVISILKMCM